MVEIFQNSSRQEPEDSSISVESQSLSIRRALEAFENRRLQNAGIALGQNWLERIRIAEPMLDYADTYQSLSTPDLPRSKERCLSLMKYFAPEFAKAYSDYAVYDHARIPDLIIHAGYTKTDPNQLGAKVVELLTTFNQESHIQESDPSPLSQNCLRNFIAPQYNSAPPSQYEFEAHRHQSGLICSPYFSGYTLQADLPTDYQKRRLIELTPSSREIHIDRPVLLKEVAILETYGRGGHFDVLIRDRVAEAIANRLKLPVTDLDQAGIDCNSFQFRRVEDDPKSPFSASPRTNYEYFNFDTRFSGGTAQAQIVWDPDTWGLAWSIRQIKIYRTQPMS